MKKECCTHNCEQGRRCVKDWANKDWAKKEALDEVNVFVELWLVVLGIAFLATPFLTYLLK